MSLLAFLIDLINYFALLSRQFYYKLMVIKLSKRLLIIKYLPISYTINLLLLTDILSDLFDKITSKELQTVCSPYS